MTSPLERLPTWVLSSAATRAHRLLQHGLAEVGVTGYEYRCLAALAGDAPLSQTEVGAAAALDARDVTHTLRALEGRGLVARAKDPGHGRRVLATLTPAGRRLMVEVAEAMEGVQEAVFGGLSTGERAQLVEFLERIG